MSEETAVDCTIEQFKALLAEGLRKYQREGDPSLMVAVYQEARAFIGALLDAGMRYEGGRWVGGE